MKRLYDGDTLKTNMEISVIDQAAAAAAVAAAAPAMTCVTSFEIVRISFAVQDQWANWIGKTSRWQLFIK